MRLDLYQLYDDIAGHIAGPIVVAHNDAVAIRMVRNTVRDPQSDLRKNLRDYKLIYIGTQNEETGQLETNEIRTVITGAQILATMEADNNA